MSEPRIKVEKRNRPPVSCEPCRTRKLKCNRAQPCESCIKRNKVASCHYAPNASRGKPPSKTRDLKDRLDTLENLVSGFLSGNISQSALPQQLKDLNIRPGLDNDDRDSGGDDPPKAHEQGARPDTSKPKSLSEAALPTEGLYLQQSGDGQLNYISPGHWESILDDIKEVREHLTGSVPTRIGMYSADSVQADASFLFGDAQPATMSDILLSLPPRARCDMLLSGYFNLPYLILAIIHPDKFRREYEAFWASPQTTSPLWIALLFAILGIASGMRRMAHPDQTLDAPNLSIFQQRCVQCLVIGKYATANEYALEAFVLHLQSMFLSKDSPAVNAWFQMGTIIRLAFRMGYHRDPDSLPRLSVFEGEMRRRVWLNVVQTEALLSFQTGFPSMIPVDYCDTRPPRNLHYSDLTVDMTVLPPSRPLSEHTPARYSIVKNVVMSEFRKLVAHTQSRHQPDYDKTLKLDSDMRGAYNSIPDEFKRRPISQSYMDGLGVIFERVTMELLFCKGLIVLHRRYITEDLSNSAYDFSRRACVEAALDILARQLDLYKSCEPGGRLQDHRSMVLALPNHDYLLAAMVICLDLSVRTRNGRREFSNDEDGKRLDRELQALKMSQQVWTANDSATPETHIASMATEVMVRKLTGTSSMVQNKFSDTDLVEPAQTRGHAMFSSAVFPSWSGQATMPSYTVPQPEETGVQLYGQQLSQQLPWAASMGGMIDGTENIDWGSLDQYFLLGMDEFNADYTM